MRIQVLNEGSTAGLSPVWAFPNKPMAPTAPTSPAANSIDPVRLHIGQSLGR